MKALHQIQEEDPTLLVEQNAQLKQTIIHGQGQLHLDIIKYRIEKLNGLVMEFEKPRIPYRETITRKADEMYRHKNKVVVPVSLLKCICGLSLTMKAWETLKGLP